MNKRISGLIPIEFILTAASLYAESSIAEEDSLMNQLKQSFKSFIPEGVSSPLDLFRSLLPEMDQIYFYVIPAVIIFILIVSIPAIVQHIRLYSDNRKVRRQFLFFCEELQEELKQHPELNQTELGFLLEDCTRIGEKIDTLTNRKNNSKKISVLVYGICRRLDMSFEDSFVYFCASMVYDAGFLALSPDIFLIDTLTAKELKLIKEHTKSYKEFFDFIPKKYMPLFCDAAQKHHENLNGKGYPDHLRGDQIPLIARLIRIVESYISLRTERRYHKLYTKKRALSDLRSHKGSYDNSLVRELERVI